MSRIIKKPEERRREIVSASRSLFLSQGYENTTIQDVMNKLQIAKGTTYHYFKSKEELLEAVIDDMVTEHKEVMEKTLNESKGNAIDKMKTLINVGRTAPSSSHFSIHQSNNKELHARLLAVTLTKLAPLYARVISQGCEEEVFRVDYPLECAEILLAGIQFITDVGCHSWSSEDLERRMKAIPTLIENQLHAPKGVFNTLFNHNYTMD